MDEAEDVGRGAEFLECFDDGTIGVEILLNFAGLDVKDVNQHRDVGEDGFALRGEVGFGEGGLSAVELELAFPIYDDHQEGNACPPQSHRFNVRFPMNFAWLCSTSIVAPRRRTSFAT